MIDVTHEKYNEILDHFGGQEFLDWYDNRKKKIASFCEDDKYIVTISDFIDCWKAAQAVKAPTDIS
jgi:hypothetical protein